MDIFNEAVLKAVTESGASILVKGQERQISAHHVMIDMGEIPVENLYDGLVQAGLKVFKIGDNQTVGGIGKAIWSGYQAAVRI